MVVTPGSERLVELAHLAPGEYLYHCRLFGHEGTMKGILAVLP